MGHGGTLDPLAAGVLIVGIGRGTKHLNRYLACSKTYETVVAFGASTDTYDCTGVVTERASSEHVTKGLIEHKLSLFVGKIVQVPPIYSALKIDGMKACEYARGGKELPRELESREMQVEECTLIDWYAGGQHPYNAFNDVTFAQAPAANIRLTVCSGFYVRSFAHDLGIACSTRSHMAALRRTRQADYTIEDETSIPNCVVALTYADLDAGEEVWGAKLRPQLETWVAANPAITGHVNGRAGQARLGVEAEKELRPKQRFRGGWLADTKQERIKQQGGKYKGKWSRNSKDASKLVNESTGALEPSEVVER